MKIIEKMEQIKKACQVSYEMLFCMAGICAATFRRWKCRIQNGLEPVARPGPKPINPQAMKKAREEVRKLEHRTKRSHGVGELRKKLQKDVSRRDLDRLIADARQEAARLSRENQYKVDWHQIGSVWAMDIFETKMPGLPCKAFVLTIQDLASVYKFPPLCSEKQIRGQEVAAHLEQLFRQFKKPLFLKIDNGGNLNHKTVSDLLDRYFVIPINSPAYYAPYNGAIEHTQGEFKKLLLAPGYYVSSFKEFTLRVKIAAHDLNHQGRRKLHGLNSCLSYFGKPKNSYSNRKRKEVVEWISQLAVDIIEKSGQMKNEIDAWRIACRIWLEKNGLVSITKPQKVLPGFFENFAHN